MLTCTLLVKLFYLYYSASKYSKITSNNTTLTKYNLNTYAIFFWNGLGTQYDSVAVLADTQAVIRCNNKSANNSVRFKWTYLKYVPDVEYRISSTSGTSEQVIYNGFELSGSVASQSRFSVSGDKQDLIINSTQLSDAGTYKCTFALPASIHSTQLVVLGN